MPPSTWITAGSSWLAATAFFMFAISFAVKGGDVPPGTTVSVTPQICPATAGTTVSVTPQICPATAATPGPATFMVDTHVYSWTNCTKQDTSACAPEPPARRYTPEHTLPFNTLATEWWSKAVAYGVLTQISFMGTDNSYIMNQVRARSNLRAVIVVHNADGTLDTTAADFVQLQEYHDLGARGIRLNLKGKNAQEMDVINGALENGKDNKDLWAWMKKHNWHVEAQQTGSLWVNLIAALQTTGCRIVVDHFATPDKDRNVNDPGFQAVLKAGLTGNVWMKASGTFRLGVDETVLYEYARLVKKNFGINRILWGSDYPYPGCKDSPTHCEDSQSFDFLLARLKAQFPDLEDQQKILTANPAFLYSLPLTNPFN